MIQAKLERISVEQLMTFYGFYLINKQNEFLLYKNNENIFVFVYRNEIQEIKFLDSLEFKEHNKLSIFLFFNKNFSKDTINKSLLECIKIEEDPIELKNTTNRKDLLRGFFGIKKAENYIGTPYEDFIFERNGQNCCLFYKEDKPIDIVLFKNSDEIAYSEFGNNFGYSYTDRGKDSLMLTYNANLLLKSNITNHNVAVTKFNITLLDLLDILNSSKTTVINIPVNQRLSKLYKLRILLLIFSTLDEGLNFNISHSSNLIYLEVSFIERKDPKIKLKILNFVSSLKGDFQKQIENFKENVSINIKEHFDFDFTMKTSDEKIFGSINFKNNETMLDIFISNLITDINTKSKYQFH